MSMPRKVASKEGDEFAPPDRDPLGLAGIDPDSIQAIVEEKELQKREKKQPTQLEKDREARLQQKEARMSDPSSSKGVSFQEVDIGPPPPVINKSLLLDKLEAYRSRFPHLKKRNNVTNKSSVDDIQDELHWCEVQLGSTSEGGKVSQVLVMIGMGAIETVTRDYWNPLNLNLDGLGVVAKNNMSELEPIVDELMIKYNCGTVMSPEIRLGLTLGAMVMTVHAANTGNPHIAAAMAKAQEKVVIPNGADKL